MTTRTQDAAILPELLTPPPLIRSQHIYDDNDAYTDIESDDEFDDISFITNVANSDGDDDDLIVQLYDRLTSILVGTSVGASVGDEAR